MKNPKLKIYLFLAMLVMAIYMVGEFLIISETVAFIGLWRFFGITCLLVFTPFFLLAIREYNLHRESESHKKQFSELVNFIDHATIISRADSKGKITYVNKKFSEVSGYTLEEVVGKDHNIVNSGIHPPEMWKDMYKTVIKDKKIWNQIVTNRSKSGSLYHVDTYIKAEFDPVTGALNGYTSIRQDLTALKNKEQEIRSRMDAINKSNAVIEFGLDKKIIYANGTFCSLFGYKQEELQGQEHRILVSDAYAGSLEYVEFWNSLFEGKYLQAEYERVKKDGGTIWLQATYNPVFDVEGRLIRILKIASDITQKVFQEREIESQRSQFAELVNFVDNAAIVSQADSKGKITYVNKKFSEVSGYTLEEVVGKDHNIVNSGIHPSEMWKDMYRTVIKDKKIWNQIVTNRSKSGSLYHVDTYIKAEFDSVTGTLNGYTSIRQDLTALKNREQEIRNRMNAINKSNAVIEFDLDRKVIYANDTFCNLFGYTQDELRGQSHQILVPVAYAQSQEYADFWSALLNGNYMQAEYERVKKDGSTLWLQATYNPVIDLEGKLIRVLKIATDITKRVKQEEEIVKKNTYLEHAARILRHDMHSGINTYLPRGISSLRRRISDEKIAEMKLEQPFKMIEGGLKHTQRVYQGVYEFTNLVKKDTTLKLTDLNLKDILTDYLSATAYRGDVQIDDLPNVMVSEQLFCTAVDNLIRNGLRYNDSLTKMVRIYMVDEQHLGILDNGRGITQEEFDLFSKNSLRRENQKESGSGLGLGICVAILKEHNFTIFVEPNKFGTLIKIKIK